jgi:prepilin-type N-terminal cleavage/methylation domain-containing protein
MPAVRRHRGFSLLEVLMAGTVLAVVLVPALEVMRRSLEMARDVETVQMTTTLCVSKMEEQLALAAYGFTSATTNGNFSADGYASIRFTATRSDTTLSGGIPDRLMAITVTVWQDDNGNSALNAGEISTSLTTKVAKMAIYQTATGGA